MDAAKAEAMEKKRKLFDIGIGASWMAPFSKLHRTMRVSCFLPREHFHFQLAEAMKIPASHGLVPKAGPVLAASATTTVNVGFSGTSVFSTPSNNEGHCLAHCGCTTPRFLGLSYLDSEHPVVSGLSF
jgi:hypothetical protein